MIAVRAAAPGRGGRAAWAPEPRGERTDAVALLARAAERLRRVRGRIGDARFALLCLSVDQLDVVGAGLGPLWSEALLGAAEARIAAALGPADAVAALGGGRFAVLVAGERDAEGAVRAAERVQARMEAPFALGGHEVFSTVSVGVAVAGAGYVRAEDLLRDAQAALAQACARGRGLCRVFEPAMHARALEQLRLEAELRHALDGRELVLHYQPIVCLESGRVDGFEALLRWRHPRRGLLPPAEFLPVAEASGLVVPVGRWVLAEACARLRRWRDRHPGAGPLSVNVNLSTRQFLHPRVVADVEDALAAAGLPGNALRLELTEGVLMESGEAAVDTLCRLKALGVQLCIDDFGVGYSSLSYLHRFPVDVLKIDRSFVGRLGADAECAGIVRAIVALAHGLGLHVVPEGVETVGQLEQVRALECGYGQGFLFAAPLDADEAEALLASGRRW